MLNRFSHLGFVFFEDVNARFRGDFSIAMTEVLGNDREEVKFLPLAKVKLQAVKFEALPQVKLNLPTSPLGETSLTK